MVFDALQPFFVFLYLLGMAALIGGLIAQWGERRYHTERALYYGAFLQIITLIAQFTIYVDAGLLFGLRIGLLGTVFGFLLHEPKQLSWFTYHIILILTISEVFLFALFG